MSGHRAFSLMRRRHRRAYNHTSHSTSSNRHHSRHQGATSIQPQFHLFLQLLQRRYLSRITYASSSIRLIVHITTSPSFRPQQVCTPVSFDVGHDVNRASYIYVIGNQSNSSSSTAEATATTGCRGTCDNEFVNNGCVKVCDVRSAEYTG